MEAMESEHIRIKLGLAMAAVVLLSRKISKGFFSFFTLVEEIKAKKKLADGIKASVTFIRYKRRENLCLDMI